MSIPSLQAAEEHAITHRSRCESIVHVLNIATQFGLENLRKECLADICTLLCKGVYQFKDLHEIVGTKAEWEAMDPEDNRILLRGMVKLKTYGRCDGRELTQADYLKCIS